MTSHTSLLLVQGEQKRMAIFKLRETELYYFSIFFYSGDK